MGVKERRLINWRSFWEALKKPFIYTGLEDETLETVQARHAKRLDWEPKTIKETGENFEKAYAEIDKRFSMPVKGNKYKVPGGTEIGSINAKDGKGSKASKKKEKEDELEK